MNMNHIDQNDQYSCTISDGAGIGRVEHHLYKRQLDPAEMKQGGSILSFFRPHNKIVCFTNNKEANKYE